MKREFFRRSVEMFLFIGLAAVFATAPVFAQETAGGGYEFGPGLAQTSADAVDLRVPARTTVGIVVALQRNLANSRGIPVTTDVNVVIEVLRPDGSLAISQTASATVIQAGLQIPSISLPGIYISQRGCPDRWRVRIRTPNNLAPPVRVFGTVTFAFARPGTVNLAIEGGAVDLNGGGSATRTLAGHDLTGLNRQLIAGTGRFRVRAKWHTDPLDIGNFGRYFPMRVELLRPNGTVAASETGFSHHAPSDRTPKVDFTYTATAQDALLAGTWRVRVTNPAGTPKTVGFGIEKGLVDPLAPTMSAFNSTFQAQCTDAVGVL